MNSSSREPSPTFNEQLSQLQHLLREQLDDCRHGKVDRIKELQEADMKRMQETSAKLEELRIQLGGISELREEEKRRQSEHAAQAPGK